MRTSAQRTRSVLLLVVVLVLIFGGFAARAELGAAAPTAAPTEPPRSAAEPAEPPAQGPRAKPAGKPAAKPAFLHAEHLGMVDIKGTGKKRELKCENCHLVTQSHIEPTEWP